MKRVTAAVFALLAVAVAPAASADPISELADTSALEARVHCVVVSTFDGTGEDCL